MENFIFCVVLVEIIKGKSVQIRIFFSGPYFPIFWLNTGKHGPEIYPYLDTFQAVNFIKKTLWHTFHAVDALSSLRQFLATNCVHIWILASQENLKSDFHFLLLASIKPL